MLTKKLKLSALSEMMLKDKEMGSILGGEGRWCTCSCAYANQGGSSSNDNSAANYDLGPHGGYSTSGCNVYETTGPGQTYAFPWPSSLNESVK
jgi:natural product precursor